jgi:Fibronectin type III domain
MKLWVAISAVMTASVVLAVCAVAAIAPSQVQAMSAVAAIASRFAAPTSVSVSSVTATGAVVKFALPSSDRTATSERVVVYPASNPNATAFSATVTKSPVTVTGLNPSTRYFAEVSVNAANGHSASAWQVSSRFTTATAPVVPTPTPTTSSPTPTPTPTTSSPTPTPTPTTSSPTPPPAPAVPFAPALSSYATLAQSYSASDIINDGWAQDANNTEEGGSTCPVGNTTYSASLDAVVLTTGGTPVKSGVTDCGHIRSQNTVPTSGDVVEANIWLPSLSSAKSFGGSSYPAGTLLNWTSMWTDGANSTNGSENWPADTEVDAVETQYGTNYVSVHYGSLAKSGGSTGDWTTEPKGWEAAGAIYATGNSGVPNVQPGWNVVDIEFTSTVANIYFNGALYVTIPANILSHKPAYLNFGTSGPNGNDPNYPKWPAGAATEDVRYVKVFT